MWTDSKSCNIIDSTFQHGQKRQWNEWKKAVRFVKQSHKNKTSFCSCLFEWCSWFLFFIRSGKWVNASLYMMNLEWISTLKWEITQNPISFNSSYCREIDWQIGISDKTQLTERRNGLRNTINRNNYNSIKVIRVVLRNGNASERSEIESSE